MKSSAPPLEQYDIAAATERISATLADPIEESPDVPGHVHGPGAIVRGTVLFVDVRGSHALALRSSGVQVARLYRAFVSEIIDVLTDPRVRHVGSTGDRVWAVYDTPTGADAGVVLDLAARANALRWLINRQLRHDDGSLKLEYGIGIDYGPLIMINTDPDTDTGGNVSYTGETMHRAAELAHLAGRQGRLPIDVGNGFAVQLDPDHRSFLHDVFRADPDDQGFNGNLVDHRIYAAAAG